MYLKYIISLSLLIFISACDKVEYSSDSLEFHSYIWNRKTSDSLSENIRYSNNFLNGFSILASEVNWVNGKARVKNSELPKEKYGINSISIRVNNYPGLIEDKTQTLLEITKNSLSRFTNNGFKIDEIQIDYDCPSSKLKSYAALLSKLKENFNEKISITALPSWLNQKPFKEVIDKCDNYVLQLHSLTLPKNINAISPLFNPEKADKWVKQAAKLGRSFSISLPTYGYYLGFDEKGSYLGVSSEQGPKNWPQKKILLTDSDAVNSFVQRLKMKHPKLLTSIFWFRLHHDADSLNWNSDALRSITLGHEIHEDDFELVYERKNDVLTDVFLRNNSSIPQVLKKGSIFKLQSQSIHFADSLENFSIVSKTEKCLTVSVEQNTVIPPGRKIPLGWIRSKIQNKEDSKS